MPRRPAKVTEADISRAIRAARKNGAGEVVVDAEGHIHIALSSKPVAPDNLSAKESYDTAEWELSAPAKATEKYPKRLKGT